MLDLCGGTADLAILAAGAVGTSGRVTLYDFSPEMIYAGMFKISKTPFVQTVNFVCGDAEEIAASDDSFDTALIGFGLRNLSNMEKGLREVHRVIKPGGKLVCLEFSQPVFPLLRRLYDIYSFYVIPFAGKVFSGSSDAYNYLPLSIRKFPLPEKLSSIMQDAGFSNIIYKRLTNGIAVIHAATKL